MLDFNSFTELARNQKFGYARVFNMSGEQFARYPIGKETGTVDGLIAFFAEIKQKFGGQWKILCKLVGTSKTESECTYYVEFTKETKQEAATSSSQPIDVEQIKKEEREKIEQELKIKELELREKELKQSVKQLEEPMGKVASIFNMWLEKLSNGTFKMKRDPVLQGEGEGGGSDLIEEKEVRPGRNGQKPDTEGDLQDAISNFKKAGVSDKFLLELSKKVIEQPELKETVRSLLNLNC